MKFNKPALALVCLTVSRNATAFLTSPPKSSSPCRNHGLSLLQVALSAPATEPKEKRNATMANTSSNNSNDSLLLPDMSLLDEAQQELNNSNNNSNNDDNEKEGQVPVELVRATKVFLEEPSLLIKADLEHIFPVLVAWSRTSCLTGATTAERILQRLQTEQIDGNTNVALTHKHYSVVLDAWARSQHFAAAERAEAILLQMETLAKEGFPEVAPTRIAYNSVMHAYQKQANPKACTSLLERMIMLRDTNTNNKHATKNEDDKNNCAPTTKDYNVLLAAHAKRGEAVQAEEVLAKMVEQSAADDDDDDDDVTNNDCICAPDLISYNCVLDAWSKSGLDGAPQRAQAIVTHLLEQPPRMMIRPDAFSYSAVAAAWVRSHVPDAVERVEVLLDAMEDDANVQPDLYLYNTLLAGWAVSGRPNAAFSAQDVLERMEDAGVTNTVSYNTVIKAWKQSSEPDAAQRAEEVLRRMEELAVNGSDVQPDVFTYTTVIGCYAASKQVGSADKAERLLADMMQQQQQQPDESESSSNSNRQSPKTFKVKPNTITINCVLDALAKSGEKGAAERAERLLIQVEETCLSDASLEMVRLNTISYTTVIDAFAKSRNERIDSAQRAQEVFQRMEDAYYQQGNLDAKPNVRSFNAVIHAWVNSGDVGSVERAERILNRMEDLYAKGKKGVKGGDKSIQPTVITYSIIMNGWAKSGGRNGLARAEAIFEQMTDLYESGENNASKPNFYSYVTLIDAIVQSGEPGAPKRAEEVLYKMHAQYKAALPTTNGKKNQNQSSRRKDNTNQAVVKPNTQIITTVIDCWGKSGMRNSGERAEKLFNWMLELYEEGNGDVDFLPNEMSFNTAINAWAKSRTFGKAYRAKAILQKMVLMYENSQELSSTTRKKSVVTAKPNVFTYTAVLNACAYTVGDDSEKHDALAIAANTFKELCQSKYAGNPNHVTYGTYITACKHLLPEGDSRGTSIETVFKKCCKDGQVNNMVVSRVESALSSEQLVTLFDNGTDRLGPIPPEWSRNVKVKRPLKGAFQHNPRR